MNIILFKNSLCRNTNTVRNGIGDKGGVALGKALKVSETLQTLR